MAALHSSSKVVITAVARDAGPACSASPGLSARNFLDAQVHDGYVSQMLTPTMGG